jgi:hypothetical protein
MLLRILPQKFKSWDSFGEGIRRVVRLSEMFGGVCKFEKYCCKAQWSLKVAVVLTHGHCVYPDSGIFHSLRFSQSTAVVYCNCIIRFIATVLSGLSLQWRRTMFSISWDANFKALFSRTQQTYKNWQWTNYILAVLMCYYPEAIYIKRLLIIVVSHKYTKIWHKKDRETRLCFGRYCSFDLSRKRFISPELFSYRCSL